MQQLYLSWSSLRNFEECRAKASLMRRKKKNPAQDIRGFFHGTVADRVMREWLNNPDLPRGGMVEMVESILEREERAAVSEGDGVVRWKYRDDKAEVTEFVKELVTRLEPILREHVLPYEFEPSKRFKTPLTISYLDGSPVTIHLVGEMDLLVRNDAGRWKVWDLKATKDENYWRKTIGQIVFYDVAVYSMFGSVTDGGGLIQPMCSEQVKSMGVDDQQRAELLQRIERYAHALWRDDMPPREDTTYCTYCPVKHACPKFEAVGNLEQRRLSLFQMQSMSLPEVAPKEHADLAVDHFAPALLENAVSKP